MPRTPHTTPKMETLEALQQRMVTAATKLDMILRTMRAKNAPMPEVGGVATAIRGANSLEYLVSQLERGYQDWLMDESAQESVSPEGTQPTKKVAKKAKSGTRKKASNSS